MLNGEVRNNQNFFIKAIDNFFSGDILRSPAEGAVQGFLAAAVFVNVFIGFGYTEAPDYAPKIALFSGGLVFAGAALGYYNKMSEQNRNNQHAHASELHND